MSFRVRDNVISSESASGGRVEKRETSKIQKALDNFYKHEMRQHKKDGTTAVAALQKSFEEVKKLSEWGKLVLLPAQYSGLTPKKHAYHVASAFQFLVLCVVFQQRVSRKEYAYTQLSTAHFPKEKQQHAEKSVNIVLGDLSLALMYNILLEMPASAGTILRYEGLLAGTAKDIFSNSLLRAKKTSTNIFSDLFLRGVALGADVADLSNAKGQHIITKAKHFWKNNKKETAFADSFLNKLAED